VNARISPGGRGLRPAGEYCTFALESQEWNIVSAVSAAASSSFHCSLLPRLAGSPLLLIHESLEFEGHAFPSGETLMKALTLMVVIALAPAASGWMTHRTTIDSAKAGTGTVPQTHVIEI
jgi:hypothetical protein